MTSDRMQICGKRNRHARSALVKQESACYIWTARLLALPSKQMWTEGLAPSGALELPGDDGVRDETSGRSRGVTT